MTESDIESIKKDIHELTESSLIKEMFAHMEKCEVCSNKQKELTLEIMKHARE